MVSFHIHKSTDLILRLKDNGYLSFKGYLWSEEGQISHQCYLSQTLQPLGKADPVSFFISSLIFPVKNISAWSPWYQLPWLFSLKHDWSKRRSKVAQSCPTLWDPMDCSLPGSSHGISQARVLEWVAISFSRGSSPPRDRTRVSRIVDRHLTIWATRKAWLKLSSNDSETLVVSQRQGCCSHYTGEILGAIANLESISNVCFHLPHMSIFVQHIIIGGVVLDFGGPHYTPTLSAVRSEA